MRHQHLRLFLLLPLLATAAALVTGEPPVVLVCRGHEPEWNLRIDGSTATLATLDARGLGQARLEGRLQETGGQPPSFVYRGREETSGADLVAMITPEACVDTMADAAEGGAPTDYTARVSLPDGATRQGCCSIARTVTPPESKPSPLSAAASATTPGSLPAPAPAPPAPAAVGGQVTAITLPDGRICRGAGPGATASAGGRQPLFDCGAADGQNLWLVGPLEVGKDGLLAAGKTVTEWRDGETSPRNPVERTAARVSEITLVDGLTCRFAGTGATLAFEGRRASYTCGMKDGDTVALLGDLEPVEGGLRILRARIAAGASGFTPRSTEPILITAPR